MNKPNFEHLPQNMKDVVEARKQLKIAYDKVNSKNVRGDKYMMAVTLQQAQAKVKDLLAECGKLKLVDK